MSERASLRNDRQEAKILALAERDEVARSFFGGRIRVMRWPVHGRNRRGDYRYSLIVGKRVETIGAWSEREAVAHARAFRRFLRMRDGVTVIPLPRRTRPPDRGATCPACGDLSSWQASRCESCGGRLGVLPPGDLQSARDDGRGTLGEA